MADGLVSLRESELREKLADAWDAGRKAEMDRNPYRDRCPLDGCNGRPGDVDGSKLCASHEKMLCTLLDAAGLPRPGSPA